jgi:hypothetical protein
MWRPALELTARFAAAVEPDITRGLIVVFMDELQRGKKERES